MNRWITAMAPVVAVSALAFSTAAPAQVEAPAETPVQVRASAADLYGVWRNPKDTVHVDIRPCGGALCGFVVWATPQAQADARRGGGRDLIGLQLFRNFSMESPGVWRGKVYVPDMNRTFAGAASLVDETRLRARGCLVANLLCKSQLWRRVR